MIVEHLLAVTTIDPGVAGIVLGAVGLLATIVFAVVIWRGSTRAAKIAKVEENSSAQLRKVDQDAYDRATERARKVYEAAIDQLEEELARVNLMARDLQAEVFKLNSELVRIKKKALIDNGTDPQPVVDPEGDAG